MPIHTYIHRAADRGRWRRSLEAAKVRSTGTSDLSKLVQFPVSLSGKSCVCMYVCMYVCMWYRFEYYYTSFVTINIYIHTYIHTIPTMASWLRCGHHQYERLNHISLGLLSPVMRLLMQPLGRMICLQRQRGFPFLSFPSVRFLL